MLSDLVDKAEVLKDNHGDRRKKVVQGKLYVLDLLCVGIRLQQVKVVLEGNTVCSSSGPERRTQSERLLLQSLDGLARADLVKDPLVYHAHFVIYKVDKMGQHDVERLRGHDAACVFLLLVEV